MQAISVASREQTQGIQEISAAVTVVDQSTQRNASTVEEASAAAQELSNEAQRLRQLIGRFKISAQNGALGGGPSYVRAA